MPNKTDLIKSFLPGSIDDVITVQIDMDICGLGVADILRNISRVYHQQSRERANIKAGRTAICVLCKSELLKPMKGIFIVIGNDSIRINGTSQKYAMIVINEDNLDSEDDIINVVEKISLFMIKNYKDYIQEIELFYKKYLYDEYEQEMRARRFREDRK